MLAERQQDVFQVMRQVGETGDADRVCRSLDGMRDALRYLHVIWCASRNKGLDASRELRRLAGQILEQTVEHLDVDVTG